MNPNARHIIDNHHLKGNYRPSGLSVLRLFAVLFVALSPAIAAARPAVVLGSFTEKSNAAAMLETLAERDDLTGIALTAAVNETRDNTKGQRPLFRVIAYTPDPSQTRALLTQLRAAGFTKAWHLSRVALDSSSSESKSSRGTVAATADTQHLRREAAVEYSVPKTAAPVSKALAADPVSTKSASQASVETPTEADSDGSTSFDTQTTPDGQTDRTPQERQDRNDSAISFLGRSGLAPTLKAAANALTHESLQWSLDLKAIQDSLPNSDLKFPYFGKKSSSYVADLHLEWQQRFDKVTLSFDHVLQWNGGDIIAWSRSNYGAPELRSLDDRPRKLDLTSELTDGDRYRLHSHFRELMVRWEGQQWNAGMGRDTINWGTGIVFHPMGLFNPLPPLHVNGDDQLGQDHIMIERLWRRNESPTHSLSFWHVDRRNTPGTASSEDISTTALKWHLRSEDYAFGLTAAQHYDAAFLGVEATREFGGIAVSSNLTLRERDSRYSDSSWGLIGVINARMNVPTLTTLTASVFVEFFHNDFGLRDMPNSYTSLPLDLGYQLARQEAYTFMRDYIAVGGDLGWPDSITQNVSLITNLHDRSLAVKAEFSYAFQDYLRLQLGLITAFGDDGKEFTPQRIGTTPNGGPITWGADRQIYLRWEIRG